MNEIIKDRDKYKTLYKEEQKFSHENKITIESQKRLIQSSTHFNSSGKIEKILIRPMSGDSNKIVSNKSVMKYK